MKKNVLMKFENSISSSIPSEILILHIFYFLKIKELLALSRSNKYFQELIHADKYGKKGTSIILISNLWIQQYVNCLYQPFNPLANQSPRSQTLTTATALKKAEKEFSNNLSFQPLTQRVEKALGDFKTTPKGKILLDETKISFSYSRFSKKSNRRLFIEGLFQKAKENKKLRPEIWMKLRQQLAIITQNTQVEDQKLGIEICRFSLEDKDSSQYTLTFNEILIFFNHILYEHLAIKNFGFDFNPDFWRAFENGLAALIIYCQMTNQSDCINALFDLLQNVYQLKSSNLVFDNVFGKNLLSNIIDICPNECFQICFLSEIKLKPKHKFRQHLINKLKSLPLSDQNKENLNKLIGLSLEKNSGQNESKKKMLRMFDREEADIIELTNFHIPLNNSSEQERELTTQSNESRRF